MVFKFLVFLKTGGKSMTEENKKFVKSKIVNFIISALTTAVGIITALLTGNMAG